MGKPPRAGFENPGDENLERKGIATDLGWLQNVGMGKYDRTKVYYP